jgi:plastocyanin
MEGMSTNFTGARPLLLALILGAGGAVVFGAGPGAGFSESASAAEPALLPAVAAVHIKNFKYDPATITVHAGDRVTFVNDDDEAHTVTASDKAFDSEGLDGSGTWQHVFAKSGTFHYFCELHPYMKATVVVLDATVPAK